MATNFPGSLDDFATTSPANLGDDDSTGRTHPERHNDMESAMEQVQSRLIGSVRTLTPGTGEYTSSSSSATTGLAMTLSRLYVVPFFCPAAMTIDRIGCYVNAATASSTVRLGIYANGTGDKPGALIVDGSTVDTSTTGHKEVTVSQAVSAGLLWLAAVAQTAAPTIYQYRPYGWRLPTTNTTYATADVCGAYWVGSVTGALPDPFGASYFETNAGPSLTVRST